MTKLAENRDTRERSGLDFSPLMKAAEILYAGGMVAVHKVTGLAEAAADAANLIVRGRAEGYVDNTNDGARVQIHTGIFPWNNSAIAPVTLAYLNKIIYVEDDNTVTISAGSNAVIAGALVDIDDAGVWVDCRPATIAAVLGSNPQAAVVAAPAALTAQAPAALTAQAPAALTASAPAALTAANPAALTSPAAGTGSGADATTFNGAQCDALRADLAAVRAEVVKLVTDMAAMRTPIAATVTDVAAMRTPIAATVVDVAAMRTPIAATVVDVAALRTPVAGTLTALKSAAMMASA